MLKLKIEAVHILLAFIKYIQMCCDKIDPDKYWSHADQA